ITRLLAGRTYTLRMRYYAVDRGLHAYDFLGSVDGSRRPGQQIVPCSGVAGTAGAHRCGEGPSTLAVPPDTNTTFPSGRSQRAGDFSAWGAPLDPAVYHACRYCYPVGVSTPGLVHREIDVTFTADGTTVVLGWGGHLASVVDWGAGRTFIAAG